MRAGIFWAVIALWGLVAVSCRQDPIFQIIASETAPLPPLIEGAPTNMVVFERTYPDRDEPVPILYVASGQIHWYAKAQGADVPQWDLAEYAIEQPGGTIISALAVAQGAGGDNRLYALCRDGNSVNATLRYMESQYREGEKWKTIHSETAEIQSIYAAGPQSTWLFAGTGKNDLNSATYAIWYVDSATDTLKILRGDTALLSGVAYRDGIHYLSTKGNGIYEIVEDSGALSATQLEESPVTHPANASKISSPDKNRTFMGIIQLNDETIIAIERNGGALYLVKPGSFEQIPWTTSKNGTTNVDNGWMKTDKYTTDGLALWEDYLYFGDPAFNRKTLVAGIQGGLYSTTTSSHTYGYVEFDLNSDGSLNTRADRREAGNVNPLQSVDDQNRYMAGLGKHPINHLFQTPKEIDPEMTFFASTQTAGLWSYRDRPDNGGWQWNAEN